MKFHLLTPPNGNAKMVKSNKGESGFLSTVLHLWPGDPDICPSASPYCAALCLGKRSGRAGITHKSNHIQTARKRRTNLWRNAPTEFLYLLNEDIAKFSDFAITSGFVPALRLNGTSDIAWEDHDIFTAHPHIQFYDYTKIHSRMLDYLEGNLPVNYHLTFSFSGTNESYCHHIASRGGNVAVVFSRHHPHPATHLNLPVFNGDTNDLRFLDPPHHCIALTERIDTSGKPRPAHNPFFVIPTLEGAPT